MQDFPHHYTAVATAEAVGDVLLEGDGLPTLQTASPPQFGGPEGRWSPETLLIASVADCFILTFRAIASASKLPWAALSCEVEGTLDRVDRVTQFTRLDVRAALHVPPEANEDRAHRLLERAEQICLVTNSLKAERHLDAEVIVSEPMPNAAP